MEELNEHFEDNYIIYVLKLRKGHYYIGQTNNLEKRLQKHFLGMGSEWTKNTNK